LSHPAAHVYTNEDLERPQILLPEDRARIQAASSENSQGVAFPGSLAGDETTQSQEIPLGDVARHYRALRWLLDMRIGNPVDVLPGGPVLASPSIPRPSALPAPSVPRRVPAPGGRREFQREFAATEGVRVRRGDSLWRLASRFLGHGTHWQEIFSVNPELTDPNLIRSGQWLRLPRAEARSLAQKQRVRPGDSLWKIAQAHFGDGLAWACLAQVNPQILNPRLIYPGQVLSIPAHCIPLP
jgi:nucleoid-associated protein YgaU